MISTLTFQDQPIIQNQYIINTVNNQKYCEICGISI